jgi:hypothetical protein
MSKVHLSYHVESVVLSSVTLCYLETVQVVFWFSGFFLGLQFDHEVGGENFHRNVGASSELHGVKLAAMKISNLINTFI